MSWLGVCIMMFVFLGLFFSVPVRQNQNGGTVTFSGIGSDRKLEMVIRYVEELCVVFFVDFGDCFYHWS